MFYRVLTKTEDRKQNDTEQEYLLQAQTNKQPALPYIFIEKKKSRKIENLRKINLSKKKPQQQQQQQKKTPAFQLSHIINAHRSIPFIFKLLKGKQCINQQTKNNHPTLPCEIDFCFVLIADLQQNSTITQLFRKCAYKLTVAHNHCQSERKSEMYRFLCHLISF